MSDYGIIAYVPLPDRLHGAAFLKNLRHYKTRHPLFIYSDDQRITDAVQVSSPDPVRASKNKVACHNTLFLFGLQIARDRGLKRFIFLESDCRLGRDYWDEEMFNEAEAHPDMFVCGTPALWNPSAFDGGRLKLMNEYVHAYQRATGLPVPLFTARVKSEQDQPNRAAVFIMGALAVYNTAAMLEIFKDMEPSPGHFACKIPAFDMHIGIRVHTMFGPNCFQKLPWIKASLSTFGDRILSESDRLKHLYSGKFCGIHQYKGDKDCIFLKEKV